MTRWLIKADGVVVDVEYNSVKKAWRKANRYAAECAEQDEPFYPEMTLEIEVIE